MRVPAVWSAGHDVGSRSINVHNNSNRNIIGLSVQLRVHSTMISIITVETMSFVILAVTAGMLHDGNDSFGVAAGQEVS
jgi:hypothetical protein